MKDSLRLSIPIKLAVVALALLLPIATLLYLLVSEKNIAINFGTKEYYGNQYLRPLTQLMHDMPEHQVLVQRKRVFGESVAVEVPQRGIEDALTALTQIESKYGKSQGFNQTAERIEKLKKSWKSAKDISLSAPVSQVMEAHAKAIVDLRALITYVGDTSNLILDPDLDSYYLMDVTLIKIPNLVDNFYQAQQLAETVLKKGQVTADEKTRLTVLQGLIQSDLTSIRYDHDTAYGNTKDRALKDELESPVANSQRSMNNYLNYLEQNILKGTLKGGLSELQRLGSSASVNVFEMADSSIKGEDRLLLTRINGLKSNRNFTLTWVTLLTLVFVALGIWIITQMVRAINRLKEAAQAVRQGDLDQQVEIRTRDELEELSRDFNSMVNSIRSSNQEMESTSQLIAEDKARLQNLVDEITAEITAIQQNAEIATDNARIVSETAASATVISEQGETAVQGSVEGVKRIKEQIETVAGKILELSAQTQAIGEIIATVDEISRQSKFLAFNASIEASKVGEHGKGFAIVANEIKNLSEESKEATKKISDILNEIQGLTNTSVMLAEDATKLADTGYQLSTNAGDTINKLSFSIQNSAEAAYQITSSAMEQQSSLEQLARALQATLTGASR